jgi:hypothetical protein
MVAPQQSHFPFHRTPVWHGGQNLFQDERRVAARFPTDSATSKRKMHFHAALGFQLTHDVIELIKVSIP